MHRIGKIKISKDIHLSFITPDGPSTFAHDNAEHFQTWWLLQCAKLNNPDRPDYFVVLHRRQFTKMIDTNTGFPIKKISSCLIMADRIIPSTAEEARLAFHMDADTQQSLPRMTDHVFVDFNLDEWTKTTQSYP